MKIHTLLIDIFLNESRILDIALDMLIKFGK